MRLVNRNNGGIANVDAEMAAKLGSQWAPVETVAVAPKRRRTKVKEPRDDTSSD